MKTVTFTDKAEFQNTFANFGAVTLGLRHSIGAMLANGEVTVECPSFDPAHGLWDGLMFIKFNSVPSAIRVINLIVQFSRADEVSMEDEKTLRLWWD